jgi:FkbM family methyltransferase
MLARVENHSFLTDNLRPGEVVVDLGVNEGAFTRAILDGWGCHVVGVEPVPALFDSLPHDSRLSFEQKAITNASSVRLHVNAESCASIMDNLAETDADVVDVQGTTLTELLDNHGVDKVALLKVDIEGAELDMFETTAPDVLRRCRQITVEFHDFLDPTLRPRVEAARRRIVAVGFREIRFSRHNDDVLFLSPDFGLSSARALWLRSAVKYWRGIGRITRRILKF